jgi:hypothetical protein
MGWVWRLRAVFIFYRGRSAVKRLAVKRLAVKRPAVKRPAVKRAASASAAVAVLLLAAGMRGACLPREKSAPLDEERFGDVHWYETSYSCEASHSRETGDPSPC